MKFLIDAQLPRRLANVFKEASYEAIHTLDLPNRNATKDVEINQISIQEQYVVISKDSVIIICLIALSIIILTRSRPNTLKLF